MHSSEVERSLEAMAEASELLRRLRTIPSVGLLTARSVLLHAKRRPAPQRDRLRAWALDRERARGHNKAAVALANKLARIVWAVWRREQPFTSKEEATA